MRGVGFGVWGVGDEGRVWEGVKGGRGERGKGEHSYAYAPATSSTRHSVPENQSTSTMLEAKRSKPEHERSKYTERSVANRPLFRPQRPSRV